MTTKGPADFVSDVDRSAEDLARQRFADAGCTLPVVGEERGGETGERYWIIDPLDGTTNYLSGLPIWGVSIALVDRGRPALGVVAAPALDLHVFGGLPFGLQCTGRLGLQPPRRNRLVAIGRNAGWTPRRRAKTESRLEAEGLTVVSLGSCAVSLALVALGRLAGYVEEHSRLWDCAAGVALCRAAGVRTRLRTDGEAFSVSVDVRRTGA